MIWVISLLVAMVCGVICGLLYIYYTSKILLLYNLIDALLKRVELAEQEISRLKRRKR